MLMVRRAPGIVKGGCWCFPGGHVEVGETPRRAVRRELREELGIEVDPVERLGAIRLEEPGYVLAVWRVRHVGGRYCLAKAEIAETRWVTPREAREIEPGLPSNLHVLSMLGA